MATRGKEHMNCSDESHEPVDEHQQRSTDEEFKDAKSGDTTSSDEESSPKRVTRARGRQTAAAAVGSDSDIDGPRTRGASKAKTNLSPAAKTNKGKQSNGKSLAKKNQKDGESDDSDSAGDYVHVQVGDCVMLDSGDPDDPYVALVSSVQTSQRHDRAVSTFMAQWYYKPYDVKEEVKALIKGGVLENEVFLSPHKDRNSIDAVIEVCQVVSPEEYNDIQDEIKRGYREKGKMFFVCRYKYYPNRSSIKKALEVVENEAIRSGLGRPKPNVGASYQATIPDFIEPALSVSSMGDNVVPWKTCEDPAVRPRQMWSPLVVTKQSQTFIQFRDLVDTLKFAAGNIVKTYRPDAKPMGHQRLTVLKSELCSPLSEDLAMQQLYLSRFNLSQAAYGCSKTILHAQRKERKAFRREVELFAKAKSAAALKVDESLQEGDSRKRKK
ncbi:Bromo adjacent homology (BAH) domain [Phytophthora cactorum]|nr:Bromo adjacent homology (BAH) domain [Phytophthora cactorum]